MIKLINHIMIIDTIMNKVNKLKPNKVHHQIRKLGKTPPSGAKRKLFPTNLCCQKVLSSFLNKINE